MQSNILNDNSLPCIGIITRKTLYVQSKMK